MKFQPGLGQMLVNIFDDTCQHHVRQDGYFTSTEGRKPKVFSFVHKQMNFDGITLFTDRYILDPVVSQVACQTKIGWCLESPAVQQIVHNNIHKVASNFDYIFTYREDLIQQNPKKFIPNTPGGTFIKNEDIKLNFSQKTKNCSLILSGKRELEGHQLRHLIAYNSKGIDLFGWGSPSGHMTYKLPALQNYKFSITIENTRAPHYFTEKLIDCLLTGCIPIYWGATNIDKYFNIDGFVIFNDYNDLVKIKLNPDLYAKKQAAIKENFNLAQKYISSDDVLASKIIKLLAHE